MLVLGLALSTARAGDSLSSSTDATGNSSMATEMADAFLSSSLDATVGNSIVATARASVSFHHLQTPQAMVTWQLATAMAEGFLSFEQPQHHLQCPQTSCFL